MVATSLLQLSAAYDGYVDSVGNVDDTSVELWVRRVFFLYRTFLRFSVATLDPEGLIVDSIYLRLNVIALVTAGLTHIGPYNGDGLADPQPDAGATKYTLCATGVPYGFTRPSATGLVDVRLGGTVKADLVAAAQAAAQIFSLGLYLSPQWTGSSITDLEAIEDAGSDEPKLLIEYHYAHLPVESGRALHRAVITNALGVVQQQVMP